MSHGTNLLVVLVLGYTTHGLCDTTCPDRWMAYKGSCYMFEEQLLDFTQAEQFCRSVNSHIVHITSHDENTFVKRELQRRKWQAWWLGLTDVEQNGVWRWTDLNTPLLQNVTDWYPGQPNYDGHCAVFLQPYGFRWEDTSCLSKVMPVCEQVVGIS